MHVAADQKFSHSCPSSMNALQRYGKVINVCCLKIILISSIQRNDNLICNFVSNLKKNDNVRLKFYLLLRIIKLRSKYHNIFLFLDKRITRKITNVLIIGRPFGTFLVSILILSFITSKLK